MNAAFSVCFFLTIL